MNTSRLFICNADIQIIFDCSINTATRHKNKALKALGLPKGSKLSISEFCAVNRISIDDFWNSLKRHYGVKE
jgi:hypothetical protein